MDVNEISQVISNVGFPIAASVGLFYLYNKTLTEVTAVLSDVRDSLRALTDEIHHKEARANG